MSCSSGTSSGFSSLKNSTSQENLQEIMDQKKRKRMDSNRESARRSRQRKLKLTEDLMGKVGQLREENNQFLISMDITTQLYLNIEAENSILNAQMAELTQRLESLNEIINIMNASTGIFEAEEEIIANDHIDCLMMNHWSSSVCTNQPIMY